MLTVIADVIVDPLPFAAEFHPASVYPVRVGEGNVPYTASYVTLVLNGDTVPPV
jgi:hypothetical protein